MQLSATFAGTAEQTTYLRDLIVLMGRRLEGDTISDLQLDRFPALVPVANIGDVFPGFDPDGFSITHSEERGEISIEPSHHWAITDPSALAFALRGMLDSFDRHDEMIVFDVPAQKSRTAGASRDARSVVCTSHSWSIGTPAEARDALRAHEDRLAADATRERGYEEGFESMSPFGG